MATADMFLKMQGVTGETTDPDHKDEIEVISWSWDMEVPHTMATGMATKQAATFADLVVGKRADRSTPTLMGFLRDNKVCPKAKLTVRKAGEKPLEYLLIELDNVRVLSIKAEADGADVNERVTLGFSKARVTYTPQGATGGSGGGANVFEVSVHN